MKNNVMYKAMNVVYNTITKVFVRCLAISMWCVIFSVRLLGADIRPVSIREIYNDLMEGVNYRKVVISEDPIMNKIGNATITSIDEIDNLIND